MAEVSNKTLDWLPDIDLPTLLFTDLDVTWGSGLISLTFGITHRDDDTHVVKPIIRIATTTERMREIAQALLAIIDKEEKESEEVG